MDILLAIVVSLSSLAGLSLYVFCLIDLHRHAVKYHAKRNVWLNFIWGAPLVGCIVYLLNRKRIWRSSNSTL